VKQNKTQDFLLFFSSPLRPGPAKVKIENKTQELYNRNLGFRTFWPDTEALFQKHHIEKRLAFSIPKKRRFWLHTKKQVSINGNEVRTVKNSHIGNDLILIFKNGHINDTHSQGYYCQVTKPI
jgi:hypothetical protein